MIKNISIIGVGKLGLCFALNLEKSGFNVIGYDINEQYINNLKNRQFVSSEPFVNEYLQDYKNIKFTSNLDDALKNDVIFIVVNTPSTIDWKYDHSQIEDISNDIIKRGVQLGRKELIINCTTFPGYCDTLNDKLNKFNYHVSYNPEFIAQGTIINDQINCDSVLIGEDDNIAGELIQEIYLKMCKSNPIINRMSRTEAEISKLSINCFLTTKISFANMVGDISVRYNCNPDKILNCVGSDSRIGNKYLKYGFGFGGPCFPRDNRALSKCGEDVGIDAIISKATDIMNEKHLEYQISQIIKNDPNKENVVTLDYITYKKESVMIEESQQFKFALKLIELGYNVEVLDKRPEVVELININK